MISMALKLTSFSLTLLAIVSCNTSGRSATTAAQPERPIATSAPKPASNGNISSALAGQWTITQVGSTAINREEDIPYVIFNPAENRFYGSNGCNIINGGYKVDDSGYITFDKVISTMKYCADVTFDTEINEVLADGRKVKASFKTIGNESYLYLSTAGNHPLMTLRRADMDFLNGQWQVTEINGTPIDDEEANVFFDVSEGKVHGNTGCNYFNGTITFDPNEANSVNFSEMGVTRMACNKGEQERNMLVALERATTAIPGGHDTVLLTDGTDNRLLTLKRIPIEK